MENSYKEYQVISELKTRINKCRNELEKLLEELDYVQNIFLPRLLYSYNSLFGELENEYQAKQKIAVELDRRIELLTIRLKNDEVLTEDTFQFVNNVLCNELKRIEENQTDFVHNLYSNKLNKYEFNGNNKNEITTIYRKLVKRLHPDNNGESREFIKFWNDIQRAYSSKNLQRLKFIYHLLYPEENNTENIRIEEEKLRSEIRELELNIITEQHRIQQIKNKEPFIFQEKLNDKFWVAIRKLKLRKQIFDINRHIHKNETVLYGLNF